jgi:hypothetical protein
MKMRTLGLSPHLIAKNIGNLSEKHVEMPGTKVEIDQFDATENYMLESISEGSPANYTDLDIISTSPSLDQRIKSNSCVQI